jgi:hypothetical protein
VSPEDAIKVALELKKDLVDQGLLSLTQADLEKHLFRNMEVKGYGHIYRERFTMTLKYPPCPPISSLARALQGLACEL